MTKRGAFVSNLHHSSPSILVQEATAWCAAFGPISRDREMRKGFDDTLWMRTRQVLRKLRRIFVWRCEDWPLPCTAPVLFSKQVVAKEIVLIYWCIFFFFCLRWPPLGKMAPRHQRPVRTSLSWISFLLCEYPKENPKSVSSYRIQIDETRIAPSWACPTVTRWSHLFHKVSWSTVWPCPLGSVWSFQNFVQRPRCLHLYLCPFLSWCW